MEDLSKEELAEINGGENPEAYELGHKVGDFVQEVVRGVLLLKFIFVA
jgi:bacteriocin-like protein